MDDDDFTIIPLKNIKLNFNLFKINAYKGMNNNKKIIHNTMEYLTIIILFLGVIYAGYYVIDNRINPEKYFEFVPSESNPYDNPTYELYGKEYTGEQFNTKSAPGWWTLGNWIVGIIFLWNAFTIIMRFIPESKLTTWWNKK